MLFVGCLVVAVHGLFVLLWVPWFMWFMSFEAMPGLHCFLSPGNTLTWSMGCLYAILQM